MFKRIMLTALVLFSTQSFAGSCGAGKVTRILVGAWNSDDLIIKIDYSESASSHTSNFNGYIRYKKSQLGEYRSQALLSLALSAYHADEVIYTHSHSSDCANANEISLRKS